jgi:hypothetical protein
MSKEPNLEHISIREAYLQMTKKAKYRPGAPSDGFGGIRLGESELKDSERLADEAYDYATRFIAEENTGQFSIGKSNLMTNRAFVYTIEACRLLCDRTRSGHSYALKLLEMAVNEVKCARKRDKEKGVLA